MPTMQDCQGYYELGYSADGVYTIEIPNSGLDAFEVWCDFFDGHGWTTIQKRMDGSVDFYIYWDNYKNGFGNIDGEHWMGNDRIHALTETNQKLNIYLEAADGTYRNGYWSQFYISDESDYYRLTVSAEGYSGDAEESLTSNHNGMRFSTRDRDYDNHGSGNCAVTYTGAWWYNGCHTVNLNGIYTSNGVSHSGAAGVNWCCDWKGHSDSLLKTIMRVTRD
ncbi:ficolin-2-like [Watersipora subatra]|uniref:ficolin-2-like n=1 Tax=Watersipora subatra TaxID=2589382 RepID=UPI00355C5524